MTFLSEGYKQIIHKPQQLGKAKEPHRTSLGFGMTARPRFSPKHVFRSQKIYLMQKTSCRLAAKVRQKNMFSVQSQLELEQRLAPEGDEI